MKLVYLLLWPQYVSGGPADGADSYLSRVFESSHRVVLENCRRRLMGSVRRESTVAR